LLCSRACYKRIAKKRFKCAPGNPFFCCCLLLVLLLRRCRPKSPIYRWWMWLSANFLAHLLKSQAIKHSRYDCLNRFFLIFPHGKRERDSHTVRKCWINISERWYECYFNIVKCRFIVEKTLQNCLFNVRWNNVLQMLQFNIQHLFNII